jgi:hypothetical protein
MMFLSSYLTPNYKRVFGEQQEDIENLFVKNACLGTPLTSWPTPTLWLEWMLTVRIGPCSTS